MKQRDYSKLPVWAQNEMKNLRERAETAERRLRESIEPQDERSRTDGWLFEVVRDRNETLLRLPVEGMRMQFVSPLGFSFGLSSNSPGLLQFNCNGNNRDRIVAVPRSSNVIELGAVPLFGGEIEGRDQ